jgi:hypothetical protein
LHRCLQIVFCLPIGLEQFRLALLYDWFQLVHELLLDSNAGPINTATQLSSHEGCQFTSHILLDLCGLMSSMMFSTLGRIIIWSQMSKICGIIEPINSQGEGIKSSVSSGNNILYIALHLSLSD